MSEHFSVCQENWWLGRKDSNKTSREGDAEARWQVLSVGGSNRSLGDSQEGWVNGASGSLEQVRPGWV